MHRILQEGNIAWSLSQLEVKMCVLADTAYTLQYSEHSLGLTEYCHDHKRVSLRWSAVEVCRAHRYGLEELKEKVLYRKSLT